MEEKQVVSKQKKKLKKASYIMTAVLAGLVLASILLYRSGRFNSLDTLKEYIASFGALGPLFLIVFQTMRVLVPVIPTMPGFAAGAILFGPYIGFLCNYTGICFGSFIAYFLANKFGIPLLRDLFPLEKYEKWIVKARESRSYTAFLFTAMVLPLFPDDFLCYLTGTLGMEKKKFIWIILLGKPWCILMYSFAFALIK